MGYGKAVDLKACPPGRFLLRRRDNDYYVLLTTKLQAGNQQNMSLLLSADKGFNGVIFNDALEGPHWDVTDFVEVRPDVTSHSFSGDRALHGELFCFQDGLFLAASMRDAGVAQVNVATGGYTQVPILTGARFASWRLIALDAQGNEIGDLYFWDRSKESQRP